jgi:hypothetical protein
VQHTAPPVQSAASSHTAVTPVEQLPLSAMHDPPPSVATQHCIDEELHDVPPQETMPGVLGRPPSGTGVVVPPLLELEPASPVTPPSPPTPLEPLLLVTVDPSSSIVPLPLPFWPPPLLPLFCPPLLFWPPPLLPPPSVICELLPPHSISVSAGADASTVARPAK